MKKKQGDVLLRIEDEKSHVAMQAAGKAWKAIKISSAKTWTEWTEVIGPGLVKAHEEAKRLANRSVGARYNKKTGLFNALCSSSDRSGLRGLRGRRRSDPGRWCRID